MLRGYLLAVDTILRSRFRRLHGVWSRTRTYTQEMCGSVEELGIEELFVIGFESEDG
jgi:hypothetical protein